MVLGGGPIYIVSHQTEKAKRDDILVGEVNAIVPNASDKGVNVCAAKGN